MKYAYPMAGPAGSGYDLYVVLVNTSSVVSQAIAAVTKDTYTHAAISLDQNLGDMYSFGRRWSRYPFWGCFHRENLHEGFYARNDALPGMILRLRVTPRQYARAREVIQRFQENHRELRYDTIGLLGNALGLTLESDHRYTCSKFVSTVLVEAGIYSFSKPLSAVRPQDLLDLPAQRVYEGDLKRYIPRTSVPAYGSRALASTVA